MKQEQILIVAAFAIVYGIYHICRYIKRRKVLKKCFAFGEKTQNGEFPLYFHYKGKACGIDFYGDPILKQTYIDGSNREAKFLTDVKKELHSETLSEDSEIPSLAYRVGVYSVSLKENSFGFSSCLPIAEISMPPLSGVCDKWTVADLDIIIKDKTGNKLRRVLLEHPVMGNLVFTLTDLTRDDDVKKAGGLKVGQSFILEQQAEQVSPTCWKLTYRKIKMVQ